MRTAFRHAFREARRRRCSTALESPLRSSARAGFSLVKLLFLASGIVALLGALMLVRIHPHNSAKVSRARFAGYHDLRTLVELEARFHADKHRYAGLADTAALGFHLDSLNSAFTIVLAGVPAGATGYTASLRNGAGDTCAVVVGKGPRPPGMPAQSPTEVLVCW